MATVTSGVPWRRPRLHAFNFDCLWRRRIIADPNGLRPSLCVRSEEIEIAGIVIGFDNRLNVAIRIDLFEQRLRHGLPSLFPVALESNMQTSSQAPLPFGTGSFLHWHGCSRP